MQSHVKASGLLANPGFRSYPRKIRWRVASKAVRCVRNYFCRLARFSLTPGDQPLLLVLRSPPKPPQLAAAAFALRSFSSYVLFRSLQRLYWAALARL